MTARRKPDIRTEVTFEDGRKGVIAARVKIVEMKTLPVRSALEQAA
jgi:long-chain acyl-CoA synthetase